MANLFGHGFIAVLALPAAILAMQLPALTDSYQSGLAQSAREVRGLIDTHEQTVRDHYQIDAQDDGGLIEALRHVEPAHSDALQDDVAHWRGLEAAAARITAVGPVFRPFAALLDLADDPHGERRAVWQTARDGFTPRLTLDIAGLVYAVAGLMLGALVGQTLLGCAAIVRPRRRRASAQATGVRR